MILRTISTGMLYPVGKLPEDVFEGESSKRAAINLRHGVKQVAKYKTVFKGDSNVNSRIL